MNVPGVGRLLARSGIRQYYAFEMNDSEQRYLLELCGAYAGRESGARKGDEGIELDVNAAWLGGQLGYSGDETKRVVESLAQQGLVHVRDVLGVLLIHPSLKGQEQALILNSSLLTSIARRIGQLLWRQ